MTQNELIQDEMSNKIICITEKIATEQGAENVTVKKILTHLGITNRVFYNRFHNINEVLEAVYKKTALKIRQSIISNFSPDTDFFSQVIEIVTNTLVMSYESKMHFNNYVFESDSVSDSNFRWWTEEIKKIIEYAKSQKFLKDIDSDIMSYSIWCFIRGYNADAVGRNLPKDKAIENFKYSFSVLLDGMKA